MPLRHGEDPIMYQIGRMQRLLAGDPKLEKEIDARRASRVERRLMANAARKVQYKFQRKRLLREARDRYRNDPTYRLNSNISGHIRYSLKGNKGGRHWEDLVGYTTEDLIKHLEFLFEPGMSWSNYGAWQIDHIKPIFLFRFTKPSDLEFLECWALTNLQPLWASENSSKGAKYYGRLGRRLG